jgi:hypothetical protein
VAAGNPALALRHIDAEATLGRIHRTFATLTDAQRGDETPEARRRPATPAAGPAQASAAARGSR